MSAESAVRRRRPLGIALRAIGLVAVAGFVALLGWGLAAKSPDTTIDDSLARSEAIDAPGFQLDVLTRGRPPRSLAPVLDRAAADGRIALSELRGTPVVLNFWASWCDPCRQEAPVLERGWLEAGRARVLFVGLNMQDVREDAREFLGEFRITYPNVREGGRDTARRFGATGLPETYFISRRGQVVGHVIGALTPAQLRDGVAAARAGRPRTLGAGGDRRPTR